MISSYISHKQSDGSDPLLFKQKVLFDIPFPFLNQMCFISNSLGQGPAQQVGSASRAQSILLAAESCSQQLACSSEAAPHIKEPFLHSPQCKPASQPHPLTLIWTVAVRDEDNPFTLWASQENTVLWLIPGNQPRERKENINSYIIQLQPSAEFQWCDIQLMLYRQLEGWAGCQSKARGFQFN